MQLSIREQKPIDIKQMKKKTRKPFRIICQTCGKKIDYAVTEPRAALIGVGGLPDVMEYVYCENCNTRNEIKKG